MYPMICNHVCAENCVLDGHLVQIRRHAAVAFASEKNDWSLGGVAVDERDDARIGRLLISFEPVLAILDLGAPAGTAVIL